MPDAVVARFLSEKKQSRKNKTFSTEVLEVLFFYALCSGGVPERALPEAEKEQKKGLV